MITDNNTDSQITRTPPDDPLEALLQQAFDEQLSQPIDEAAVTKITARIAFEQKLRTLVTIVVLIIGTVFGVSVLLPELVELISFVSLPQLPSVAGISPATTIAATVLLALVPWLVDLVDDHI